LFITLLNLLLADNVQYLSKIEQAHNKTLFLVSSKACDEVRTFAILKHKLQPISKQQQCNTVNVILPDLPGGSLAWETVAN